MNFKPSNWRVGQRLAASLALLLGLLLAITALAMARAGHQAQQAAELQDQVLPSIRLVHLLGQHVDEARGLEALSLLSTSDGELSALATQLAAHRQAMHARLRAYESQLHDDADRGHHAAVLASLAAYWQRQDQVLAASRQALADGAPASRLLARERLTGPSQQAYAQVLQALDGWWAYHDQLAAGGGVQARSALQLTAWLLGTLSLLALAVGLWLGGAMRRLLRELPAQRPVSRPPPAEGALALGDGAAGEGATGDGGADGGAAAGQQRRPQQIAQAALDSARASAGGSAAAALPMACATPAASGAADQPASTAITDTRTR